MIRTGGDGGSVVAEFAIALPAVVIVFLLGMGALGASARQLRLQDAVADAARLAARGEADDRVRGVVGAAVPGAALDLQDRERGRQAVDALIDAAFAIEDETGHLRRIA